MVGMRPEEGEENGLLRAIRKGWSDLSMGDGDGSP